MPQEPEPQSPSPTPSRKDIQSILEGEQGEGLQKEALWHVIRTMINVTYDSAALVSDGSVKVNHDLISL